MKAADRHRDASLTQRLGEVERARELVRLNSDQHHHAIAGDADHRGKTIAADARIGLVKRMNVDLDIRPEHAPLGAILRETVERGERSRRYRGTQPLDDVAIVVVMRRLHQYEAKVLLAAPSHSEPPRAPGRHLNRGIPRMKP